MLDLRLRFWQTGYDLREGVRNRYPLCCVLRFALGTLLDRDADQADQRGTIRQGEQLYVPCGLHQKPRPSYF
jgi:hypothetical protein